MDYDDGSPHLVIGQLRATATHLTEQRGHQA